jgi:dipeptidyl-peptidase-4
MRYPILLALLLTATLPAQAEKKLMPKPLDARFLRDYAETRGFMLGRPAKAKPTPNGKAVLFLRSQPRVPKLSLFEFDVATAKTRELLTPEAVLKGAAENLSPEEKARRERQRVSVGGFADYQLSEDGRLVLLSLSGKLYVFDRTSAKVQELATGNGTIVDPKFSPDGKQVGYVRDHDVYVYDLGTGREKAVTTGGTREKTHGLAEFVAQEEMDRHTGWWWSPDGKHIAYEEADASGVEVWYVADPIDPGQKPHPTYYPRPGKANVQVRVGIVPVAGGPTVWIDWDHKKYEYLAQVRWDKYGPLTIQIQDRKQQNLVLLKVDPATGNTTPLVTEKDPAWVNIHQDVPRWLEDKKAFLWIGEDEGGPRLERRSASGQLEDVLVRGPGMVESLLAVDENKGRAYLLGGFDTASTFFNNVALSPSGQEREVRSSFDTLIRANYNAAVSKDGSTVVLTFTNEFQMPRMEVYRTGKLAGELESIAETPPHSPRGKLSPFSPRPDYVTAILYPTNFDENKKYPVLVYVYGGPKHLQVAAAMRQWLLPQWIADQGFIVAAIDNRGTPRRERTWEKSIYQKFGSVPLEDQVKGLRELAKKHPEMDLERVGIYGWSFGGYMSAQAVLKRPDVFKAAVAGAPVTDWLDYDTHYTERYLGLPQESPAAYKEASLLTYAADLKRPLLLVHGTADDNVYFRHTLKLSDALFRAGRNFEVLPLSGLTHMVPDPVVTERLYGRIAGFFKKHLGEPTVR